jgi:hypothetical protein
MQWRPDSHLDEPVSSSSLSGHAYVQYTQASPTHDSDVSGRWVALDESGWDGEQLYGRSDQYLSIGSVALDDESAALIVEQLRDAAALTQPLELKFRQFTGQKNRGRLEALAALLEPGGALADRAQVYLVDKHYFVTGKIIDLLLEEHASDRGVNLYKDDLARKLAWTLFNEGPRALGTEGFERLIATMVDFASSRNRGGAQVSVQALFNEIDHAWARSHRRRVTDILAHLRQTRPDAEHYLQVLSTPGESIQGMEPLIPCLTSIANLWSHRIGRVSVLVDEHRVLTDTALDVMCKIAAFDIFQAGRSMRFRERPSSQAVQAIVRGASQKHPSIQLADLIAGAGQATARRHAGMPSQAGERLWPMVVPLIPCESMIPHDEPERFAAIDRRIRQGRRS